MISVRDVTDDHHLRDVGGVQVHGLPRLAVAPVQDDLSRPDAVRVLGLVVVHDLHQQPQRVRRRRPEGLFQILGQLPPPAALVAGEELPGLGVPVGLCSGLFLA